MMMSAPPQPQLVSGTRPAVQAPVTPEMIPQQVNPQQGMIYTVENGNGVAPQQLEAEKNAVLSGGSSNNANFTQSNMNQQNGSDDNGEENDLAQGEQEQENSETGATEEINSDYSGDVVKLFVGQVPRTMDEADLFPIFEKYGPMQDVAIIRDKHTGQHRGCAFVTFFSKDSADACEKELHNQYTFEGGKRAVQIRPAGRKDGEFEI